MHNPHLAYRPDIDGLRALAVLSVVAYHAFPGWLPGGFVGVDIFFVISGYLITSILLKALARGEFSLLDFYSRRIRRIFPALILVLAFSLAMGWWLLLADEFRALGKHVAGGAWFLSNLVLKREAGYFDVAAELKPLLHLWSLGVEEQFYLAWPLLLMLAFRFRLHPLAAIASLLLASFLLNVATTGHDAVSAFYLPAPRGWELLTGGLLAYINLLARARFQHILQRLFPWGGSDNLRLANTLGWIGLALIVMALVAIDRDKLFPGWWALLPVLGAFFLIAAGMDAWPNRHLLAAKPMVAVGLISYPLYLWHWPLLALPHIIKGQTPPAGIRMLAVALSIALAWATYRLVEKRLRFRQHGSVAAGLFATLMLIGASGYWIYQQEGMPQRNANLSVQQQMETWDVYFSKLAATYPPCSPKNLQDKALRQGDTLRCRQTDSTTGHTVAIIGDSHAEHLFWGVAAKAKAGENVAYFTYECLPFLGLSGSNDCKNMSETLDYIISEPTVHTVMLASYFSLRSADNTINRRGDAAPMDRATLFKSAMAETLDKLSKAGKKIILVLDVPTLDFSPSRCIRFNVVGEKNSCDVDRSAVNASQREYRAWVQEVLKGLPAVEVWDPTEVFCDRNRCSAMADGELLYRDTNHITTSASEKLAEHFLRKQ